MSAKEGLKQFYEFVEKSRARRIHCQDSGEVSIDTYQCDGRMFVLFRWGNDGWDVYTPVHNGNRVDATIRALEDYVRQGETK